LFPIANSPCNGAMPRRRPQFLVRELSRHGKPVWYCRRAGRRIRLRAEYGTPEFEAEFQVAIAAMKSSPKAASSPGAYGSVAWLIERYRETKPWLDLSLATRRQRENIFRRVRESAGDLPITAITRRKVEEGRDKRAHTPAQSRHFLDALRGLFRWAYKSGLCKVDPTHGVEYPARKQTAGFPAWAEDDVAAYERRWPIGTPQRVWLDVLLYTGLRRGDAARLGLQHVRQGVASIATEKTGTIVSLPLLPVLQRTLDAGPCGDLTFIVGVKGQPFRKESFGNVFAEAARAAGVRKSCHGLRKIAATRCAENGATVPQMNAIFGWTGSRMAMHYIEAADRKRLAAEAMEKLNDKRTSNVAPIGGGASHLEKS
jgi:integrase